jgi:hypothetical protein
MSWRVVVGAWPGRWRMFIATGKAFSDQEESSSEREEEFWSSFSSGLIFYSKKVHKLVQQLTTADKKSSLKSQGSSNIRQVN